MAVRIHDFFGAPVYPDHDRTSHAHRAEGNSWLYPITRCVQASTNVWSLCLGSTNFQSIG